MASYIEDPTQWRLTTTGGIRYKYLGVDGNFERENAVVNWRALVHEDDFVNFVSEFFPPSIVIGNLSVPVSYPLPGLPGIVARRLAFKGQDSGKPIDPFNFDSGAAAGTYHPLVEVNIEFGPRENADPDETDPQTFLEITGNASGEFIHAPPSASSWQPKTGAQDSSDMSSASAGQSGQQAETENIDPDTGEPEDEALDPTLEDPEPNRHPNVPATIIVPETEWSVRWTQMSFDFFGNVMIHRLRALMGKVNSRNVSMIFNASPETLLFVGYTYTSQYTWREGLTRTPPVQVEMKFVEKRILDRGVIRGHNDFWRPGVGWETLLVDGSRKAYGALDHNILFKI